MRPTLNPLNYRDEITFTPLKSIEDIKETPHSTLLTYVVQDLELNPEEIRALLKNTNFLNELMKDAQPREHDNPIDAGIILDTDEEVAYSFYGQFIKARKQPMTYTYPSGKATKYTLLIHETSANAPFTNAAANIRRDLYLRQTYLDVMQAYTDLARPELRRHQLFTNPQSPFIGAILAHEEAHNEVNGHEKGSLEEELAVEQRAKRIANEHGISDHDYLLLHHLERTSNQERRVSHEMLTRYANISASSTPRSTSPPALLP
ncbi:hypothetical protein JXA12_02800 [Candidatus Woesearchaeota archaeon]|nr:hypothetical protein [Candidatus Woesearchaeota archaeon]